MNSAWLIATRPGLEKRDLALAEKMAGRANQATQGKEPAILDTLARVQFMNGKTNEAVATEQKAVNLAEGPVKERLQQFLTSYQQGKLPDPPESNPPGSLHFCFSILIRSGKLGQFHARPDCDGHGGRRAHRRGGGAGGSLARVAPGRHRRAG